jgi:hypothetical protein
MNSESRAATALLIYSSTITLAIILAILGGAGGTVKGLLAFGVTATLFWSVGPTLLRLMAGGRHGD